VPLTERSLGLCTITADPPCANCKGHATVHIILISAFSEYRSPLHVYVLTIKQVRLANMKPIPLDDPIKYLGIVRKKCYSSMGQSGFMVKQRNLPPLLSFSALLVCIQASHSSLNSLNSLKNLLVLKCPLKPVTCP